MTFECNWIFYGIKSETAFSILSISSRTSLILNWIESFLKCLLRLRSKRAIENIIQCIKQCVPETLTLFPVPIKKAESFFTVEKIINLLNVHVAALEQQWSVRNGVRSFYSVLKYMRYQWAIHRHRTQALSAHSAQMKNTSWEIILYRKLTMKTYYTHLLPPLNGCENANRPTRMGERAGENDCGAVMATGSCAIPFHSFFWAFYGTGPTGRRPFKVKRKAENFTAKCSTIACRALVSAKMMCAARFFFSLFFFRRFSSLGAAAACVAFDLYGVLCIVYLCDLFWSEHWTRSTRPTLRKSFSHSCACEKESFAMGFCVCFSFSFSTFCVSVSLAENEIVERNPLEYRSAALWRRRRRREESQRHRLCGVEIFLMPLFLCARLSLRLNAKWNENCARDYL